MRDLFYENQFRLDEQGHVLSVHQEFQGMLSRPFINPVNFKIDGITDYQTPEAVAEYLVKRSPDLEAEFQLEITRNALLKIRAAVRVVESQTAYANLLTPGNDRELADCLAEDQFLIKTMIDKAKLAIGRARQNEKAEPSITPELGPLSQLIRGEVNQITQGIISPDVVLMEPEELIEKIAEDRLNCVKQVLDANHIHFEKVNRQLNEAAYIMKALDDAAIDKHVVFKDGIDERTAQAGESLEKCESRIKLCHAYMAAVSKTGMQLPDRFMPVRYQSMPIRMIFEMGT